MNSREELILAEVAARENQREAVNELCTEIAAELFDKQISVLQDPNRFIACLCTRRAGKTETWSRMSTITALQNPRTLIRIWAISRPRCKELMWNSILLLCARHKIPIDTNETALSIKFQNGSEIRLLGADKDKEAQKKRGDKTILEIVIETQLFGAFLRTLVDDVIGPCTFDLQGKIILEGTPGVVCGGFWFDVSGNENTLHEWQSLGNTYDKGTQHERVVGAGWSCHHWSLLDNPKLPRAQFAHDDLRALKLRNNWTDTNPTWVREYLGRWVNDTDALYYAYDQLRNTNATNVVPEGTGWVHTLGWDLGSTDAMALVVWGFHPGHGELYEAFSWKQPGASFEEIHDQITTLQRRFNITTMVADTQGGGKMFVEQFMRRYPLPFEPAKKADKYAHVLMLNDALRSGFIKFQAGSPYALEISELPKKQPFPDPENPSAPPEEHPLFENHCCDAGLYAFRECMHYLHQATPQPVLPQSPEWFRQEEAKIRQEIEAKQTRSWLKDMEIDQETWLDQYDAE